MKAISGIEGVIETVRGSIRILGRRKATLSAEEVELYTPQASEKVQDGDDKYT